MIKNTARPSNPQFVRQGVMIEGKRRLAIRDSFIKQTGPGLIHDRQHHAFRAYILALWCCYPRGRPRLPHRIENKHLAVLLALGKKASSRRSSAGHVLAVLEERKLIRRSRMGKQRTIIVCHENGSGAEYTQPKGGGPNAYVELPKDFFVNDWINRLSAPAILVMLIALREQRYQAYRRTKDKRWNKSFDWFQPVSQLVKQYGMGTTTIEKGLKELKNCGFLTTRITARHPLDGHLVAPRNLYSNHPDVFGVTPPEEGADGPGMANLANISCEAAVLELPVD